MAQYTRYEIPTRLAPNIAPHPSRFKVDVSRVRLARLVVSELIHYRGNLPVVMSRPCVYGVFSGPLGGFKPRENLCVGCLRCTVQYPDIVQIYPNPDRLELGDSYFTPDKVDTVLYEAATGRVPVRGAGYRGKYGGSGWDGMWTDMSEIVRPTRDGIHGREFISTSVDLGRKPAYLSFDSQGVSIGEKPVEVSLPVPFLFDVLPDSIESELTYRALARAAAVLQSLAVVPIRWVRKIALDLQHTVPLVMPSEIAELRPLDPEPRIVELGGWDEEAYRKLRESLPRAEIFVRLPLGQELVSMAKAGVHQFHLTANYHGETDEGFALSALRACHDGLVEAGLREQVTLIGSGGIIAAEHVPKAIICGLDLVALDSAVWFAWQAACLVECIKGAQAELELPDFDIDWGAQRLINMVGSWRDQLLEILGAMGLREVRRLRGEIGRAMFQRDLDREAFAEIEGFARRDAIHA